jgi:hypothetical protein
VDWGNRLSPGAGYTALFVAATLAFVASAVVLRGFAPARSTTLPMPARVVYVHEAAEPADGGVKGA